MIYNELKINELGNWCLKSYREGACCNLGTTGWHPFQPPSWNHPEAAANWHHHTGTWSSGKTFTWPDTYLHYYKQPQIFFVYNINLLTKAKHVLRFLPQNLAFHLLGKTCKAVKTSSNLDP